MCQNTLCPVSSQSIFHEFARDCLLAAREKEQKHIFHKFAGDCLLAAREKEQKHNLVDPD